jgi:transcriptional regulator with XRE-family HTH domain
MAERSIGAKLRTALEDKGWSYTRLVAEMRKVAARQGKSLPSTASLIAMLSRWLNDHDRPSRFYREILSSALGLGQAELQAGSSQELAVRLPGFGSDDPVVGYRGNVDGALLDDMDSLTDLYRRMDRRLGAVSLFEDLSRHLQRVTALRHASMTGADRQRLASIAGTLRRCWAGSPLIQDKPPAPGSTSAALPMLPRKQRTRRYRRSPSRRRPTSRCSAVITVQPYLCCARPGTLRHLPARQRSGPGCVARRRKLMPSQAKSPPASVPWIAPRPPSLRAA